MKLKLAAAALIVVVAGMAIPADSAESFKTVIAGQAFLSGPSTATYQGLVGGDNPACWEFATVRIWHKGFLIDELETLADGFFSFTSSTFPPAGDKVTFEVVARAGPPKCKGKKSSSRFFVS